VRRKKEDLFRKEVIVHLKEGATLKGFLIDEFDDSILIAKPVLLEEGESQDPLIGEALVYKSEVYFMQVL
jgi:hypothetical protein